MKILNRLDNYINEKEYSMIYKYNKLDIVNYTEIKDFTSKIITIRYQNKIYHLLYLKFHNYKSLMKAL